MTTPIDTGRYGSPRMRALFTDRARYEAFVRVEGALAKAQGRHGVIPADAAETIAERARTHRCSLKRVAELEATSRHELFAAVQEFAESCGPHSAWVHYGATSSDILDTALALQLTEAITLLEEDLRDLLTALLARIDAVGDHVMIGRTHGQQAQPVTLGFKLAIVLDRFVRCLERLTQVRERAVMGKIAGAVGSLAGIGAHGPEVQRETLRELGLPEPAVCAQAVARDRIAEFFCWAGLTAACLEDLATEVRNLQRTEIGEVAEPFAEGGQIGSSAMPHKRNPVQSERICSLARLVRSLVGPALENVTSWHERDLANSANERFTLPEACVLLDEMLTTATYVIDGLRVFPDRMRRNLEHSHNEHLSEAVLLLLVQRGMDRLEAYRLLQEATGRAAGGDGDMVDALLAQPRLAGRLDAEEVRRLAAAGADVGHCRDLTAAAVKRAEHIVQGG
ncbi:adenylosuccinate lyase [Streptomyces rimosus]|uniref:adenylosuccinate lyase n=1 Tax=Streptomyces rimosus TaxID=1927 RepID=UPI0006B2A702|nr:adenylosuccinate lyase [Streptomyces rimosus]